MSNLVQINNAEHLTAMIKAIVPRSFVKTFDGLTTDEIVAGFRFCAKGLSQAELNTGLSKITEMGYCPDPAMFAKWCKGIDGFGVSLKDKYLSKNAALANIVKWCNDKKHQITTAEKQSYDKCAELFNDINWSKNSEIAKSQAYSAFKEHYEQIVAEMVEQGKEPETYVQPVIQRPISIPVDFFGSEKTDNSEEAQANIQKIREMLAQVGKRNEAKSITTS